VQAKKQLADMGFEYEEINIETDGDTRRWLIEQGHRTMPQIYHNGKVLVEGGAQELAKLSKDDINTALGNFDFDISMKL
jgi:glutaredoxin